MVQRSTVRQSERHRSLMAKLARQNKLGPLQLAASFMSALSLRCRLLALSRHRALIRVQHYNDAFADCWQHHEVDIGHRFSEDERTELIKHALSSDSNDR
ncbi:hypothetical protein B5V03_10040 [Bradyrhizobium betae]|uniref:Uncharacterized protein n=1 Tax=Bradyrhizobium betae TaxID=244734 RepID=A0A4Q1VGT8_9BRAD|nr:hypothetical protein B5V03_10040 [Bradyrhizobium betae]